jgi:DUF971 family protein
MPKPTNITLNKTENYLEIAWDDGLVCQYPLPHLREACPCVECRGGHQYMGMAHAPDNLLELKPARSYVMTGLVPVGNYALQPTWDDGHSTGIYTWEYLRHLCPEEASNDE